jgi:hypothetical protein
MKLQLIFLLIDILILLAYPVLFLLSKMRQIFGFKR